MTWIAPLLTAVTIGAVPTFEEVTWTGSVDLLSEVLEAYEIVADSGPIAGLVALRTDEGRIVPLLSDPASRALFADERLRGRPVEVQGRVYKGLPFLQVTSFRVQEDGVWRTPEYYCDICTISVRYPQVCPCCQGPMELRMRPESP